MFVKARIPFFPGRRTAALLALLGVCCAAAAQQAATTSEPLTQAQNADTTPTRAQMRGGRAITDRYVRVLVRFPGVYRIYGRELAALGVDLGKVDTKSLALWNEGQQVPVNLSVPEGQRLFPNDYIEFVGDFPRGTYSTFKPYNTSNVYLLNWQTINPVHYHDVRVGASKDLVQNATFMEQRHLEKDFMFRQTQLPPNITDAFYWCFFQAGQKEMYPVYVDFPGFDPTAGLPARLGFRLFGISEVSSLKPQHQFSISYGDYDLGRFGFDGKTYHTFETSVPVSQIKHGQRIYFQTPAERKDAVDMVALDSIDTSYPRKLNAQGMDLFRFNNQLLGTTVPATVKIKGTPPGTRVFSPEEGVVFLPQENSSPVVCVEMTDQPTSYVAVSERGLYPVESLDYVERLEIDRMPLETCEVLLLYHPKLEQAANFYAEYRRSQGQSVVALNVTSLFDVLNNGFIDDISLKRAIRYVVQKAPKLRYMVLLGDSSADYRESRNWDEENRPAVLIPIHWITNLATTWTGGYADDNWYGSFRYMNSPDVAIGRIPANTNEEAFDYLRKVVEYEQLGKSKGDKALLMSSVEASFQDMVGETKKILGDHFSTTTLLFPETKNAEREVSRLREEIDSGVQFLYYIGHGGSLVWRVGPTDFSQQKDLFTPKDVQKLNNHLHYPIVTASSCYTTAFDYTLSLGESLMLQKAAGAIAVIGCSWKATVYEGHEFNKKLAGYYLDSKLQRLGDVFLSAKHAMRPAREDVVDFQTFTLLGDPCLKLVAR